MRVSAESRPNVASRQPRRLPALFSRLPKSLRNRRRRLIIAAGLMPIGLVAAPSIADAVAQPAPERAPEFAPHPELCIDLNGVIITPR